MWNEDGKQSSYISSNADDFKCCKLNEYIARNEALEEGKLRTGTVGISGTDKALEAFTWGVRGQFLYENAIQGIKF